MSGACEPLEKWIQGGDDTECRPCSLAFVAAWYRDLLNQHGLVQEAQDVERLGDSDDPIQVARALDTVKGRVPPEVQTKLREYDCAVQRREEKGP